MKSYPVVTLPTPPGYDPDMPLTVEVISVNFGSRTMEVQQESMSGRMKYWTTDAAPFFDMYDVVKKS